MNWNIFRAYDVRGIYPSDMDENDIREIAKGYVAVVKPKCVAVGMDVRLSSPALKAALIESLLNCGVDVIDLGEITTDMLYFAVGFYGYDGGIVVSASHNPREYNGLKMVREGAKAISSDTGLFAIRDIIKAGPIQRNGGGMAGQCQNKAILGDYVSHILTFIDAEKINAFKVVANANFGYVGAPIKEIRDRLRIDLTPLNFEPDGSFPKGTPDPTQPENRLETEQLVLSSRADLGAIWDSDADRVVFVDERGRSIPGAYTGALLAKIMLHRHGPSNRILCDPRVTWPMLRVIREMHGDLLITKAGHAFFKDVMRGQDALFGAELSGHYYFRDNFCTDNGVIPFLILLEYSSTQKMKISELFDPFFENHFMSGELNYKADEPQSVMSRIISHFRNRGHEDFTDGYSVETEDWRFNVRSSNTEPLLRVNIEARAREVVDGVRAEIESLINYYS